MEDTIKSLIRQVADYPKPGIQFYDITTLLQDPRGLKISIDALFAALDGQKFDKVVGIESRGFLFGPAVAERLNAGFVPVRKPGKLPWQTVSRSYELEYGVDEVEMHEDAIKAGERVLIIDDLIATGGTARATAELVEHVGGVVGLCLFLIELSFLPGRAKLDGYEIASIVTYDE